MLCPYFGNAQEYVLINPSVQREKIIIGEFSMFYKAQLDENLYWVHAIGPRWHTYPSDDLPGFPEDLMSIRVVESQLQLQFKSGKYLYIHDYLEKPIDGPFRFINKENEFVLERHD